MSSFLANLILVFVEAAPYLLIGLVVAGLLHQYVPARFVQQHLGGESWKNIFKASLIGTPVPLCSCGVVPVGLGLVKDGASKATAVSFLIATPENGVESISLTYSFFGLPFTLARLAFSMLVANITGLLVAVWGSTPEALPAASTSCGSCCCSPAPAPAPEPPPSACCGQPAAKPKKDGFKFVTQEFVPGIAGWMLAGFVLSALITSVLPAEVMAGLDPRWAVPLAGLVGVPLYVCASASTPIAYSLFSKGLSPGACLVFLLTGPATNASNFPVYVKALGGRVTALYYAGIYGVSVVLGLLLDLLMPAQLVVAGRAAHHVHQFAAGPVDYSSALVLAALLGYGLWRRRSGQSASCCG